MFADLAGSVALGEEMDVEDYRDLLSRFRAAVTDAVQRFEGFVARHQGDGLLVYFGYPQAHEDDAERAIRAGLLVVEAIESLQYPYEVTVAVRVGVATGPVVVGDAIEAGGSTELAALGQTPNLAARLQGEAKPNELIVSQATLQIAGRRFHAERLGGLALKGFRKRVTAFRVVGATQDSGREHEHSRSSLSPLVGRNTELALIIDRWTKAKEGSGQVVLLRAEPGVGKSRLVREIRQRLRPDSHDSIPLQCSPYHSSSALHPVIEVFRRSLAAATQSIENPDIDSLERWLRELGLDADQHVPILGALLDIPVEPRFAALSARGEEQRRRSLEACVQVVDALAARNPVLLVGEDLHWVDPTTQELLGQLIEVARNRPILILLTFRPEYSAPWRDEPHLTEIRLNHLTKDECRAFVSHLTADNNISADLIDRIVARTDGVPLYLEELSRVVLESEDPESIPATLRDALTARLDRLGRAREVAQAAAVLGRDFHSRLLPAIAQRPATEIEAALASLARAGLVNRVRSTPRGDYQFKHALVRDAAYESLLSAPRQALHSRAAETLTGATPRGPTEIIAYHYEQAGALERAEPLWEQSAEEARQRGAHDEAMMHFQHALDLANAQGYGPDRQLHLVTLLAKTMHLSGKRPMAAALLDESAGYLPSVTNLNIVGWYHCTKGEVQSFLGNRHLAEQSFEQAITAGRSADNREVMGTALSGLALEAIFTWQHGRALTHYEEAAGLLEAETSLNWEAAGALYMTLYGTAYCACALGRIGQARRALSRLERMGTFSVRKATEFRSAAKARVHVTIGEWDAAIAVITEEIERNHPPFTDALLHYYLSSAYLGAGDVCRAVPMLEEGLEKAKRYRSRQVQLWAALALGNGYCDARRWDDAARLAVECTQRAKEVNVPTTKADLLSGRVCLGLGQADEANSLFDDVLADFAERGMRPDEAQTHLYLASLAHSTGDLEVARNHLQAAYSIYVDMDAIWFVEHTTKAAAQFGIQLSTPD